MLKHILLFAIRDIWSNKLYSVLSILGLSIAVATALFMLLYVEDNLSWDKHWSKKDSLYRLTTFYPPKKNQRFSGESRTTPPVAASYLRSAFSSELEKVARLHEVHQINFHVDSREHPYSQILVLADPDIIEMFDFDVIRGDLIESINDPYKIALNDNLARNLFGRVDVIGEKISVRSDVYKREYTVGAIYEDVNENGKPKTTVWMPVLAKIDDAYLSSINRYFNAWGWAPLTQTFVELQNSASPNDIEPHFKAFLASHTGPEDNIRGVEYSDYFRWELTSIKDVALGPGSWNDLRYDDIAVIALVAYVILILACVNFVNLVVARLTLRTRESSLRKVLGASQKILIFQVVVEVLLLLVLGMLSGLAVFEFFAPYVSQFFTGFVAFDYSELASYGLLLWVFIPLVLLCSIYPAFVFSRVRPSEVLRANQSTETHSLALIRSFLVMVQVVVSTALIACSIIVYVQLTYGMNEGRNAELDNIHILTQSGFTSVEELKGVSVSVPQMPSVKESIRVSRLPFGGGLALSKVSAVPSGGSLTVEAQHLKVGDSYFEFFNIQPIAGRLFDASMLTDMLNTGLANEHKDVLHWKVVINKDLLNALHLGAPEEAVGKRITMPAPSQVIEETQSRAVLMEIIGVIPNAGLTSLFAEDPPMFYVFDRSQTDDSPYSLTLLKPKNNIAEVHQDIREMFEKQFPGKKPPRTNSLRNFSKGVMGDTIFMSRILLAMTLTIICIAAIGVFSLVKVSVSKRTKEIGLRKVMGASTTQIFSLLMIQFSKPVLIASVLASVIAIQIMVAWLLGYSYRIPMTFVVPACLGASLISLLITWVTVGGIAIKKAQAKPVVALRYE